MMYVDLCFLKVERGFNDIEGEGCGYCISPEVCISLIGSYTFHPVDTNGVIKFLHMYSL